MSKKDNPGLSGSGSGWMSIFRTGKHTDSAGNTRDWTESDLDRMANYDANKHEAPLVIGHPKSNSPAYGWVEKIKRVGQTLYAKPRQLVPEFQNWVKEGRYKKRSISLYPDLSLKHVGFLGGVPPAVKGLPDYAFQEGDDAITIEFSEVRGYAITDIFRRLRDYLIEKEGADKANKIISQWEIDDLVIPEPKETDNLSPAFIEPEPQKEEKSMSFGERLKKAFGVAVQETPAEEFADLLPAGKSDAVSAGKPQTFSEVDLETAKQQAAKQAKEAAELEFAEKEKTARIARRKTEIKEFCEQLGKDGKVIPAWTKLGLVEFMQRLDGEDTTIEFAEDIKTSQLEWFKKFLGELPKVIEFSEFAHPDEEPKTDGISTADAAADAYNKGNH